MASRAVAEGGATRSPGDLVQRVRAEIEATHREFEGWMRGDHKDLSRVDASLAPGFVFYPPRGGLVDRDTLFAMLEEGHGQRELNIRVEQVAAERMEDGRIRATYEEWHVHPGYETARDSVAILSESDAAPGGFLWHEVREVWMIEPPPC